MCPPQPETLANATAQQNGHQIRQTGFQDNLSETVGEGDAADATDEDEDESFSRALSFSFRIPC